MHTLRPVRNSDSSRVFLHDKQSFVVAVMVEHISIANCFGSLFRKFFYKNLFYIAHRLSPPLAVARPLSPIRSSGTLFLFLLLEPCLFFHGPRSVVRGQFVLCH